jgi:hypothetical protein
VGGRIIHPRNGKDARDPFHTMRRVVIMQILFDAHGAQVQVQQATGDRLTTWFDSLTQEGYAYGISNPQLTLASQLTGVDVYVSLTR